MTEGRASGAGSAMVEVKSKFELEFRRIAVPRSEAERLSLEGFYRLVTDAHCLPPAALVQISYQSPHNKELVALESREELAAALRSAAPLLRLFVSRLRGVEVEVSGSEEESDEQDDTHDQVGGKGGEGGKGGKGGGTKGGMGRGRGGKGGREESASNSVNGERLRSAVGRGRGRSRQNEALALGMVVGVNRTSGSSKTASQFRPSTSSHSQPKMEGQWDDHNTPSDDSSTVSNGLELAKERTRGCDGSSVDGGASSSSSSSSSSETVSKCATEDVLPEHPLLRMFAAEQKTRGGETVVGSGAERRQNDTVVESGGGGGDAGLVTAVNHLSLSNGEGTNQSPVSRGTPSPEDKFPFVIEIYGFPQCLKTRDILQEFQSYRRSEFCVKWVDNTHAIGIFASDRQAWLAAGAPYERFKTRMVKDGTEESLAMAEKLAEELRPQGKGGDSGRPKTTPIVARRMVSSALGIRVRLSQEQRDREMKELKDARDRRRSSHQLKC